MADHIKPSKDELKANALKLVEEAEKLPKEPEEPKEPETPVVDPEPTPTPPPVEDKPKEEEKPETEKKTPELKERYRQSTREAQVLRNQIVKRDEAVEQATNLPQPTEEEMTVIYPEWDVMDEVQRRMAIKTELSERRTSLIHKATMAGKDITTWYTKVDKFIDDPKTLLATPELEGKQEDFKMYATKETHRGADFEVLVKAFLFDFEKEDAANKLKNKGEMFPKGSGGPAIKDETKPNKVTFAQLKTLRISNYSEYKKINKLIKEGKMVMESVE